METAAMAATVRSAIAIATGAKLTLQQEAGVSQGRESPLASRVSLRRDSWVGSKGGVSSSGNVNVGVAESGKSLAKPTVLAAEKLGAAGLLVAHRSSSDKLYEQSTTATFSSNSKGRLKDICAVTAFKSPWPIYPSLSVLWLSHAQRSARIRCSSYSSVWKRSSPSSNASVDSGEAESVEHLWKEYFADPTLWWDNRADKRNPRSPDFKHKVTRKALWIDGWSTPPWVKAMLKSVIEDKLRSHAGYGTRDSQEPTQPKRLPKGNNGISSMPTSARESRQIVPGGGGGMHIQSARTTIEAVAIMKNCVEQGISIDKYKYVDVLKRCLKEKHLAAAKQVHECMINSGMEQNTFVVNHLLRVYIRCGRLQDARQLFDDLVKKDVFSWNSMLGGFSECNHAKEAMDVFHQMRQARAQPDEVTYCSILKACASPSSLKWGEEIHALIRHAGLESDVRVGTALVKMYAKCRSMKAAREAFEKVRNHDVFSWTVMIGAYAECGCGYEAYELFVQMQREGCAPNAITLMSILNPAASSRALQWVKEVQNHAVEAGLDSDLRVASALVQMYAKSGCINDARLVFDRMKDRDVITWNHMIGGLAQHGCGREVYELFLQMQEEGFRPDAFTYTSILNPSASAGALEWVKDVHGHALKAGLESDLRVGSALVQMYAKSGSINDARLVFDRMEDRDVITWTHMIGGLARHGCGREAYELFLQMQEEGLRPDAFTYTSILNPSASAGALEWMKDVHGHALKAGLESDLRVGNALVHMYAKSGSIDDARLVFDRMKDRDVVTWNMMIGGLAQHGCGREAYELFLQMQEEGFRPDAFTYTSILNPSASAGALEWVKEVHRHALKAGLESDLWVGSAFVHMYVQSGSINDARLVFDRMEDRDVITWTHMIGGLAQHGCGREAYELFLQMQEEGFRPDALTYISILNPCASAGALEWVKDVHSHALKAGLLSDLRVGSALVHIYAKSGSIDDAQVVFDGMDERDVITWTVMIGALAQHGCGREALEVFRKMNVAGVKPNEYSFAAVLMACSHAGFVDEGRQVFLDMSQEYGIEPTVVHYTCMVDLLGRAGLLEEAKVFIDNMPVEPNGATWGALLGACRTYGNVQLGEVAAKESLKLEPTDASPYVALSNIYAAAGQWEAVLGVRTVMQGRGIRKEPGRTWIEVDNMVHDFVVGDTSHPEAKEIYVELSRLSEKIKAEGYIPDTQLVLRNIDEKEKELALCSHSEKLAIAYGLLRTPREEPIRVYKNLRVCSDCHTATKFISKVTGREIIARDANRFHHFKDGLCSCGDYW